GLPQMRPMNLPPISAPPAPSTPTTEEENHKHHERVVSEKDFIPPFLGATIPKKARKPVKEKIEYKLIARIIGSGMTTGVIISLVMAASAYGLFYFFYLKGAENQMVIPTPLPGRTARPQTINELETIFSNVPVVTFQIQNPGQESLVALKLL